MYVFAHSHDKENEESFKFDLAYQQVDLSGLSVNLTDDTLASIWLKDGIALAEVEEY